MTVQSINAAKMSANAWRVSFASDLPDPLYRVYIDGELISETSINRHDVSVGDGDTVTVEIRDDDAPPGYAKPSRVAVEWDGVPEGRTYKIEADGVPVGLLEHRSVGERHRVVSPPFGSAEQVTVSVFPLGDDGNKGETASTEVAAAQHPAQPDVLTRYDEDTQSLTIAAT